jgi:Protein of unknown function (DUF1573)
MWRWLLLFVLVIAVSAGAVVLSQYLPSSVDVSDPPAAASSIDVTGPPPSAVVEGDLTHHFGVMAQEEDGTREWIIRNDGKGDLNLSEGAHTCSCTIASLKDKKTATIKPGESTTIQLEWHTKLFDGAFEKSSDINTNDPQRPVVRFAVSGTVRPPILRTPSDDTLDFRAVSNNKPTTRPIMVYSPNRPELKIKSVTTRRPDIISLKTTPATEEEAADLKVKAAHKIEVTVTPGNNLGSFVDELIVTTDHPKKRDLVIALVGKITGPISASPERLNLPGVLGTRGGRGIVMLTVLGQETTTFDVLEKPEKLKVTITPMDLKVAVKDEVSKVKQYTMSVEVPPGTPPGGIVGDVVLKTSHSKAAQIKLPVDIIVLGQN